MQSGTDSGSDSHADAGDVDRTERAESAIGEQGLQHVEVLHVDDDPEMLELSARFLEDEDDRIAVRTAVGAHAGLDVLQGDTGSVDVVVSDYQMPEMDGLAFLEEVRERAPDLPFIVFTGKSREAVAVEAVNLGADRYLQKRGDPVSQFGLLADAVDQEAWHVRARQQLRESEERYRTLVESFPDIVMITDYESRMLYANPALERQTGLTVEEFQMAQDENPFIHPDDADRVAGFIGEFVESERTYSGTVENRFIDADGDRHWYSSTIAKVTYESQPALQFITREVTDRKRSEQRLRENQRRYRALAAAVPDTRVAVFTADLTYDDLPSRGPPALDVTTEAGAGTPIDALHPDAPFGLTRADYERVFEGVESDATFELNGNRFHRRLVPVTDGDDEVTAGLELTRKR